MEHSAHISCNKYIVTVISKTDAFFNVEKHLCTEAFSKLNFKEKKEMI